MTTATRYIGFCPICEGFIKVRSGLLVHHGYQRPGHGYIVGDCFGVYKTPHETSPETAEQYVRLVVGPTIRAFEERLEYLRDPATLAFHVKDPKTGRYLYEHRVPVMEQRHRDQVTAYEWEHALHNARHAAESALKWWQKERARVEELIRTWEPRPMKTIEEEVEHKAAERKARKAELSAKREQKVAEAIVRFQQRIDSAVRRHTMGTLRDIFESAKLRELSGWVLTKDEALRVLDRDRVWRAFGLLTDEGYLPPEKAGRILAAMTSGIPKVGGERWETTQYPWPEGLK